MIKIWTKNGKTYKTLKLEILEVNHSIPSEKKVFLKHSLDQCFDQNWMEDEVLIWYKKLKEASEPTDQDDEKGKYVTIWKMIMV